MADKPKIVDTDSPSPSKRAPEGAVTAGDLRDGPGDPGGPTGEQTAGTASSQRAQDDNSEGETSNADIEMPPGSKPAAPGTLALGDPNAPVGSDVNTLTAKNNPLDQDSGVDTSKAERPLDIPGVDKADIAERRADRAEDPASGPSPSVASRRTDTEEANAAETESDRPERRGPIDSTFTGPERRRTVDSTHGLAEGRPVSNRAGAHHGTLALDTHGRRFVPGSVHTATYVFDDEDDVDPGPGETTLVLELNTPRGRRLLPVVRTGDRASVSCTFPIEFEGHYELRLIDGSTVLAATSFDV